MLAHHHGDAFSLEPGSCDWAGAARFRRWLDAAAALPAVAETTPGRERYAHHATKYASGKARSKAGNAVRRGAAAHDYDHELDG